MSSCNFPKISVVTVCYNCRNVIAETLTSVLSQDYTNIEYVLVDGASTDGTIDIIKSYTANSKVSIKYVSEPDKGIYDAMNKGLSMVSGDWVIFMNGGDKFVQKTVLSEIFNSGDNYDGITVLFGDIIQKYNGLGSFHRSYGYYDTNRVYCEVCHQATLVRSITLKEVGFPLDYKICADFASLKEIFKIGGVFKHIPVTIAVFDQTDGTSALSFVPLFMEMAKINDIKKYSISWCLGYCNALIKELALRILSKKNFIRLRYKLLSKRMSKTNNKN